MWPDSVWKWGVETNVKTVRHRPLRVQVSGVKFFGVSVAKLGGDFSPTAFEAPAVSLLVVAYQDTELTGCHWPLLVLTEETVFPVHSSLSWP